MSWNFSSFSSYPLVYYTLSNILSGRRWRTSLSWEGTSQTSPRIRSPKVIIPKHVRRNLRREQCLLKLMARTRTIGADSKEKARDSDSVPASVK